MNMKRSLVLLFSLLITGHAFAIDPVDPSFDGTALILPVVNVGDQKFRAALIEVPLANSPTGYGFVLDSLAPTTESSDKAATYDPATGQVFIPSVELIQNGIDQGSGDVQMTWVVGSAPMVFTLDSPSIPPTISSPAIFSFDSHILTLPVVIVGNEKYRATLRPIALLSSPLGIGFQLVSAELTTASSDEAATYDPATGQVVLPVARGLQSITGYPQVRQGQIVIQMELVAGSNPLLFSVTSYNPQPGAPWYP